MENGKKRSKYLNDETAAVLAEYIDRRRKLQRELKIAGVSLPRASKKEPVSSVLYKTNALKGEVLRQFVSRSANLKSRPLP